MNILLVMVPLSIVLLVGAGFAFFWAVEHDQFDDMDTPALLPLLDVPFDEQASNDADNQVQSPDPRSPAGSGAKPAGRNDFDR
ncbi:MAG: cbb3-type cytochrome oxidase assembly protein CcoS [Dokdonella sp.]